MQSDLILFFFLFWLANTKPSVYHTLPQYQCLRSCHLSHQCWDQSPVFTGPDVCSSFTSLISHRVQDWLKCACKSRNPSLTDWRSVFKTPRKDSTLKPADTHSVYLLIHPCVSSSLFVWLKSWMRWKDLFSSLCICFPNQTNKLCEAFPSIIILL